jgi:hypothetical protein
MNEENPMGNQLKTTFAGYHDGLDHDRGQPAGRASGDDHCPGNGCGDELFQLLVFGQDRFENVPG